MVSGNYNYSKDKDFALITKIVMGPKLLIVIQMITKIERIGNERLIKELGYSIFRNY